MARTDSRTPGALLELSRDALARASRCREALELQHADVAYRQALDFIRQYDEMTESREGTQNFRQTIEAERLLVEAILKAHERTYQENIAHFMAAHNAAKAIGSKIQTARVLCCTGCTLIFEGMPRDALDMFSRAEDELKNIASTAVLELTQIWYHRARAMIANKQHWEAMKFLERLTWPEDITSNKRPPTRYELAAMVLLASQYQRQWRFGDARHMARYGLGVAHRANMQTTLEGLQLRAMSRWWKPWAYIFWLRRVDVPEV
jgi:tetratricopeptide (TPR) repeat protein